MFTFMNIEKICITSLFAFVVIFGAVTFAPQAFALGTGGCTTDCGGGDGGGNGGGGGDGGGETTPTPVCNISINKTEVTKIGESYRVTWNGTPSSATFYING